MTMLITGGSGQLGKELVKTFPNSLCPNRLKFDVTVKHQVERYIREEQPNVIVHAAALTDVAFCEAYRSNAYETNVIGTKNIVDSCRFLHQDCYFVLVSTACVFQGDVGNYTENDLPYPKNYYGLTKLLSEIVVKCSSLKFLIVRTNFVARKKWKYPRAFVDRFGTYLFADDFALAIKSVISRKLTGVVHVCGEEKMSMFELAKITTPTVKPMTMADYHGVPLTVDMSLASIRLKPFKIGKGLNK